MTLLLAALLQIDWQKDHAAAIAKAKSDGTFALVHFEALWCGTCQRMSDETFKDEAVAKAMGVFVCVRLDVAKEAKLWKELYQGRVHPSTFIVSGEGETVSRIVDFREAKALAASLASIPARVKKLRDAEKLADDDGLLAVAAARAGLEDPAGAAAAYSKLLKSATAKNVAVAAAKLASITSDDEQWDEAERMADLFDKSDPENVSGLGDEVVLPRVFALYFGKQQADDALKALRAGEKRYETSKLMDRWMFLEGTLLRERGDGDAAIDVWKRCAEKFAQTEWGKRAKKQLP